MKNVSYYRHLHSESLKKLVAITKITAVSLLTVFPSTMQAESSYSQSAVISVKAERMLLTDLFSQIEKQSEFLFFYVDKDVANIKVNVKANSNQIDEVLTQALAGTGLTYTINDRNINIMRKTYARQQQTKQIKGKVLDSNGDPIIGANVVEKGTTNGSITDIEGLFNISVAPGATLSISYIGYKPVEIKINSQNSYNITLEEDSEALDEVVVIGYGTARKIDLTGSTASLGGDKLQMKNTPQLANQLQGQMAGVQVTRSSGDPNSGATIRVRGVINQ